MINIRPPNAIGIRTSAQLGVVKSFGNNISIGDAAREGFGNRGEGHGGISPGDDGSNG